MKPLLVFTAACYKTDLTPVRYFEESCRKQGLEYRLYGMEHGWSTTKHIKIDLALEFLEPIQDLYEVALYTDGADSLLLAGEDEILEKYSLHYPDLFLSGNSECWPDPGLEEGYRDFGPHPWRFVSPGSWMGTLPVMVEALKELISTPHRNDTPAWHDLALSEYPMVVDNRCEIFQDMGGVATESDVLEWLGNRLHNRVTGSWPCVAHWSGRLPGIEEAVMRLI